MKKTSTIWKMALGLAMFAGASLPAMATVDPGDFKTNLGEVVLGETLSFTASGQYYTYTPSTDQTVMVQTNYTKSSALNYEIAGNNQFWCGFVYNSTFESYAELDYTNADLNSTGWYFIINLTGNTEYRFGRVGEVSNISFTLVVTEAEDGGGGTTKPEGISSVYPNPGVQFDYYNYEIQISGTASITNFGKAYFVYEGNNIQLNTEEYPNLVVKNGPPTNEFLQVGGYGTPFAKLVDDAAEAGATSFDIKIEDVYVGGVIATENNTDNEYVIVDNGTVTISYPVTPAPKYLEDQSTWPSTFYSSWQAGDPAGIATLVYSQPVSSVESVSVIMGQVTQGSSGETSYATYSITPKIEGNKVILDFTGGTYTGSSSTITVNVGQTTNADGTAVKYPEGAVLFQWLPYKSSAAPEPGPTPGATLEPATLITETITPDDAAVEIMWPETVTIVDDSVELDLLFNGQKIGSITSLYINLFAGGSHEPGIDTYAVETGDSGQIMQILLGATQLVQDAGTYTIQIPAGYVQNAESALNEAQNIDVTCIAATTYAGTVSPEPNHEFTTDEEVIFTITYEGQTLEKNYSPDPPLYLTNNGDVDEWFNWGDKLEIDGDALVINFGTLAVGEYDFILRGEQVVVGDGLNEGVENYHFIVVEASEPVVPGMPMDGQAELESPEFSLNDPVVVLLWPETVVFNNEGKTINVTLPTMMDEDLDPEYIQLVPLGGGEPGIGTLSEAGDQGQMMFLLLGEAAMADYPGEYTILIPEGLVSNLNGNRCKEQTLVVTAVDQPVYAGTVSPEVNHQFYEGQDVVFTITYEDQYIEQRYLEDDPVFIASNDGGELAEWLPWSDNKIYTDNNQVVINFGQLPVGSYYFEFRGEQLTVGDGVNEGIDPYYFSVVEAPATGGDETELEEGEVVAGLVGEYMGTEWGVQDVDIEFVDENGIAQTLTFVPDKVETGTDAEGNSYEYVGVSMTTPASGVVTVEAVLADPVMLMAEDSEPANGTRLMFKLNELTINWVAGDYSIAVPAGIVQTQSGAMNPAQTINFTVVPSYQYVNDANISPTPQNEDNSGVYSLDELNAVTLTFSDNIKINTGEITYSNQANNDESYTVPGSSIEVNGNKLILDLAALNLPVGTYSFGISPGYVVIGDDEALSGNISFTYTVWEGLKPAIMVMGPASVGQYVSNIALSYGQDVEFNVAIVPAINVYEDYYYEGAEPSFTIPAGNVSIQEIPVGEGDEPAVDGDSDEAETLDMLYLDIEELFMDKLGKFIIVIPENLVRNTAGQTNPPQPIEFKLAEGYNGEADVTMTQSGLVSIVWDDAIYVSNEPSVQAYLTYPNESKEVLDWSYNNGVISLNDKSNGVNVDLSDLFTADGEYQLVFPDAYFNIEYTSNGETLSGISSEIVVDIKYEDGVATIIETSTDVPGGDEPGGDEPGGDEPGGDEPGTDNPGGDEPGTDNPGGDEPGTDNPGGDEPGTDEPGTDEPGDGPSSVNSIKAEENVIIYTVNGVRVTKNLNQLENGLYIINGKKVMIRK